MFYGTVSPAMCALSLHDALPIFPGALAERGRFGRGGDERLHGEVVAREGVLRSLCGRGKGSAPMDLTHYDAFGWARVRSEEHTSELQSPMYLVCRLLLEKKKRKA